MTDEQFAKLISTLEAIAERLPPKPVEQNPHWWGHPVWSPITCGPQQPNSYGLPPSGDPAIGV